MILSKFKKDFHWFLLEMYFWYCLEFDWTSSDLWFTTRFWISMTELFYNELFHNNRGKWKSMDLSMDLWHSNYTKVILCNFAKDHCFWTLWTLTYVDCIPFSCIDYFQILFSNFQKTGLNLQLCGRNPIKSVLFICPSDCLSVHFSEDLPWIF